MKQVILKLLVCCIICAALTSLAQEQPSDPGLGGGTSPGNNSKTCYNNYRVGGDLVITKCNGCSQVTRVIEVKLSGSCTAK